MLNSRLVAAGAGVELADVACTHQRGRGETSEHADQHAVVLVRRGCFARSADGVESLLDPTVGYCMNPGEEQRYDHPHSHGDDCTAIFLSPERVAEITGGAASLPAGALPVSPALDLHQRLLLNATHQGDRHEVIERALTLAAEIVENNRPDRVVRERRRSTTIRERRRLANEAREALAADSDASLDELAKRLAVSPHHLSRVFRSQTGSTVSRHRMRLRARAALEQLAGGEQNLGRLAMELGFADQSHLCRVLRSETGQTPSALRETLRNSRREVPVSAVGD
jgi:AraC-like DNA-binding protein